jgi:hypothetical protein
MMEVMVRVTEVMVRVTVRARATVKTSKPFLSYFYISFLPFFILDQ